MAAFQELRNCVIEAFAQSGVASLDQGDLARQIFLKKGPRASRTVRNIDGDLAVRGGTKRVLVRPAVDALAITAIPQVGTAALSISATAVRMTPPSCATRHAILGWCGGIGKSNSCRVA